MIDIENELFDIISNKVLEEYPQVNMTSEYQDTPAKFPCISIVEENNAVYTRTSDSSGIENHVTVMYKVNIYSNKQSGKKLECKKLRNKVDGEFNKLGFTRVFTNPIPNLFDNSIYRIVARYRGIVSKDKIIYRR